jgi:hypothetical protein
VRPAPAPDTDWDDVFEDVTQGWMAFTQQLRFALERHPNQPRRTLYLSGTPRSAGARTATAVLGLAALGAPGTRYSVAVPGESLAGEVWHRGRHQLGVSVDGWGDGLLVLLERPPSERRPRGGSQAIVTTYGLSDDQFADLERRWTELWAQHFEATAS